MQPSVTRRPIANVGIGLRHPHLSHIIANKPNIPWLEILTDNFLVAGGIGLYHLEKICQHYPVTFHCVGMSLGSTDVLNLNYLTKIKKLAHRFQPTFISDHLCWISHNHYYLHELIPLPYTQEAVNHVAHRIRQVQDFLGQQILIENVSNYLSYKQNEMSEWEFVNAVAVAADCFILLDINNIVVSAYNHGFAADTYLQAINPHRVKQFHLAGYQDFGGYYLDSHGCPVHDDVWRLYQAALQQFGNVPTLIEWDSNIPQYAVLAAEAAKAQRMMDELKQ